MKAHLLRAASAVALGCIAVPGPAQETSDSSEESTAAAPAVEVVSTVPVPGPGIDKSKVPGNIQTVGNEQILDLRPVGVSALLDQSVGSITVNNYQGNPFQPDVSYRGFTASPLLGTPQGLSVYLDSVRQNDPFGDTVNWDLIPLNAISRVDVIPGSNPLYGLNTLGGAIALHTKDGFSDPGGEVEVTAGSWRRRTAAVELGGNNGKLGGYIAANHFQEDGWRDLSPTKVDQFFGKVGIQGERTNIDVSYLYGKSDLIGNGGTPVSMLNQSYSSIFTAPDETKNELNQLSVSGTYWINDRNQIGADVYLRKLRRNTLNGDQFDDFTDTDYDGADGTGTAFNPGVGSPVSPGGNVAPTGVFNRTSTDQNGEGFAFQYTNLLDNKNRFTLGVSLDNSTVDYSQTVQLGVLDDTRTAQLPPANFDFFPGQVLANSIAGRYRTASAFLTDTWSIQPTLHLTLSGRYNRTKVTTNLNHNIAAEEMADYTGADDFVNTNETFTYSKLNPAAGLTWNPRQTLTLFTNFSQGSRVPSPIELGCANPATACTVPTALTGDPFLPQVVARTGELGARGAFSRSIRWDASVFRTDTSDDILFVSSPTNPQQGYFSSFGKTRRQGMELGFGGRVGRFSWNSHYTYLDATFQSRASLVNSANSSSDANGVYNVQPGDRLPGIPQHAFKINAGYDLTRAWSVGASLYAQSWQYVRGNEDNLHQPGGTNADGQPFVNSGTVPGFAVVNLRTRYAFENGIALFAEIDNLFDRQYYTAGSLNLNPFVAGAGGAVGSNGFNYNSQGWQNATFYTPGAPLGVWVGVSYSFGARNKTGKD
jgi:outer membrane receptor protein involved in Fe transport